MYLDIWLPGLGGEGPGIQIKQVVGDNGNPGRTHARVYPERLYPDRLLPDSCATFFLVNVANREHAVNPSFAAVAAAAATRLWVAALG